MADTEWLNEYEAEVQEAIDARIEHSLQVFPKVYPISGINGTTLPPEEAWYKLTPERG